MPAGRPTDYGPSILQKAERYLLEFKDNKADSGEEVPTIAGLARYLNLSRDTIYDWVKDPDKKEFSDIVNRIHADREILLISGGLKGKYNPTITALMMGQLGYRREQAIDHTSSDGSMTPKGKSLAEFYDDDEQ